MFATIAGLNYPNHSCSGMYQANWLYIVCLKPKAAVLQIYEPFLLISALVFLVAFGKVACMNIRIIKTL